MQYVHISKIKKLSMFLGRCLNKPARFMEEGGAND
jgi:hypothetical protein